MDKKDIEIFDTTVTKPEKPTDDSSNGTTAEKPEQAQIGKTPVRRRHKKRRSWAFPLGLLVLALSLTGVWSIGSSVADFIKDKADGTEQMRYYESYLTWVVANDPDSFDDISKANSSQLLDISILSLLYDDLRTNDYELSPQGLVIPAADVEGYYNRLFGSELAIVHQSISGYGYDFIYDEKTASYTVPLTSYVPPFTPDVVSIDKGRETVVLTVGYIGTNKTQVGTDGKIVDAEPDKYMNITLRKTEGEYKIYSIQAANPPEDGK